MSRIHSPGFAEFSSLVGTITKTMQACNHHPLSGAWGLAEFYDNKPANYPKLTATLEWAKKHRHRARGRVGNRIISNIANRYPAL